MKKIILVPLWVLSSLTNAPAARPDAIQQRTTAVSWLVPRAMSKPTTQTPPARPAPAIGLTIQAPTTRGPWTMHLVNDGDIPVRIVADARLLTFDVTPRGARSPVMCQLPEDMRTSSDLERALVVPPKRSYEEAFEPRLYCFGRKLDALVPGAIVVAHLGWTTGPKTKSPFEASPIEGIEPEVASLKSIDALPIALPDEPSVWAWPMPMHGPDFDVDSTSISLKGPNAVDAAFPNEIEIPITIRNDSKRTAIVRFRPEVLGFDVIGSGGTAEHCIWPTQPAAALREMFTTLAPRATETLDVSLRAYCVGRALEAGGLVVVRPWLDTTGVPGASLGLRTFDGVVVAQQPTFVRLHHGTAPPGPLRRPRLEDE